MGYENSRASIELVEIYNEDVTSRIVGFKKYYDSRSIRFSCYNLKSGVYGKP
ncbi:MAG: hypothetical protein ACJA2L_001281 [Polaribacter sp.]|jgi:hypothetical protein